MSFFSELKRRNVFKVAAAYMIVSWLVMQAGDTLAPALRLPDWINSALVFFLLLGFPLALIFAWAFEITPDGLKKEKNVDRSQSITHISGQKLNYTIIGLLVLALGFFAFDKFVLGPKQDAPIAAASLAATPVTSTELTVGSPDARSIAVLPFMNRSANEENASFFSDGVHDELLTNLSRIKALKVISRTSVMAYRNNTKNLRLVGEELGVANILEGGVQRVGDRVRINVQLIDAKTDEHLWAEIYDRQLTASNIFMIQSEIAMAIADALRANLLPDEQQQLDTIPTADLAALEAYFLGKQALAKRTSTELKRAADFFATAIELDPNFALAYVGKAASYLLQTDNGNVSPREAYTFAFPLIEKALEIDDQSGEAYATLGLMYTDTLDRDRAETAFRQALRFSPNLASTRHWYSNFLRLYGQYEAGLKQINAALLLDPLSAVLQANLGTVLTELARPEEAVIQFRKIIKMYADYPVPYWSIGGIYWTQDGRLDEALLWFKQGLERNPDNAKIIVWIALLYLELGDETEAEHWANRALEIAPNGIFSNWAKEELLLVQGENTQAKEYANKVLLQDPGWAHSLTDLKNQNLREGRGTDALARYKKQFPALFNDNPEIDRSNVNAAIDLNLIMTSTGQPEQARILLERSLDYIESKAIQRLHWYAIAYGVPQKAQIYALQGKSEKSLEVLRRAIDNNQRGLWTYWLEHDPNLDSIRAEPEFKAMVEEIKADMASQLQRVRNNAQ